MNSNPSPVPHIHVACGVLRDAQGRVLVVERPAGKIAALKWEFPGGKIEPGETPRQALDRELHEEIGIVPREARPLVLFTHAYAERVVTLHTWLVTGWDGEVHGRESQRWVWQAPDAPHGLDVLPTVDPILRALRLPADYVFTPPDADERLIRAGLPGLPRGALLRLRLPALDVRAYAALARRVVEDARGFDLRVMIDRGAALAADLGAAGWHETQRELSAPVGRGDESRPRLLHLASCHDAASLARAREAGCDAAVLGTVAPTRTHAETKLLGWEGFASLAGNANLPVYAIGGLGPRHRDLAFAHHAQGVAGISAYWSRSGS